MTVAAILAAQKRERCKLYVEGFEHNTSSVEEMQTYAGCVDRLHPGPMSEGGVVVGKVCVSLMLLAFVIGVIYGWRDDGISGGIYHGLLWPISCAAGIFIFFLVFAGIGFVLL